VSAFAADSAADDRVDHFGVVVVLNLLIGLLMRLVGIVIYIVCSIAMVGIKDFTCECWPKILALLTFNPPLVVGRPNLVLQR
jgi:TRAP-type C4-dicarboxylate transport system permease large subunit